MVWIKGLAIWAMGIASISILPQCLRGDATIP
jgi:hypothetical protein